MMVSIDTKPPSLKSRFASGPVVLEHLVRCQADADFAVSSILSTMRQFPFAASDGFAVQLALSQALQSTLEANPQSQTHVFRIRTHATETYIRMQIEEVDESPEVSSRFASLLENQGRGLNLVRTFMTNVEFRRHGRQVILYRVRGQGSAISGPPIGYDFQI